MSSAVSFLDSPPPKRRRRRPARSCEQCRRRKIRCNMAQPCSGCVRARAPMQCSYRDASPGDVAAGVAKARDLAPAETRPQTDEQVAAAARKAVASLAGVYPRGPNSRQPRGQGNGDDTLAPNRETSELSRTGLPSHHSISTSSSTTIPPLVPRLRHVPEKTKLFGQTHWLHTAEKFPISGTFHPVEVEPSFYDAKAELLETLKEARNLRFAIKKQNSATLDQPIRDLRETLPAKPTCDDLLRCYFRTLEPLYRIIHIPSFRRDYDQMWDDDHASPLSTVFLMKLTLILALGTTFIACDDTETSQLRRLAQMWIQNAQWWLTGPSEKTTHNLDGLQVFCLLLLARQATFNCQGATSWLSSGSLLRMAITMGLHRNPDMFSGLSLFQKELRARLWTTVLELCVQSCLDLGLPLNLSGNDYDARPPSNFNDSDLDSSCRQAPAPADTATDSSLQILLAKSLPLRIQVVGLLNDFRHEQAYEKAIAIGTQLRAACRDVAAFFHGAKYAEDGPQDGPSLRAHEFHRKFMDIHLRRFIMFLHRDFMLHAKADPRLYLSRKICVEAAMVIGSSGKDSDFSLPMRQ
ncbi:hypothetical protein ACJZ2D_005056 [Fusarium nematophilum]